MGIVNVTPDSFSDGGQFINPTKAIAHATNLIAQGADILDIGGESTRPDPNAQPVTEEEELRRIMPVLQGLINLGVPISVDTRRPAVMKEVIAIGVDMINDTNGFRDPQALAIAAASNCGLCVMHMQGTPQTMQINPQYSNVVGQVSDFLLTQRNALLKAGVNPQRILLDPGFGFGKTLEHNLALMQAISGLAAQHPILVGVSRKRMIGQLIAQNSDTPNQGESINQAAASANTPELPAPANRVAGSVAAALWAASQGAQVLRVHDVKATVDALKVWRRLECRHDTTILRH